MSRSKPTKPVAKDNNRSGMFYFGKQNYYWMFAGLVLIISGLILMAGGGSDDPNVYNEKELFSFRRITLAPILMSIGFVFEVIAIMRKPKVKE